MNGKVQHCRGCGAEIIWIRTPTGKAMPCDAQPVAFRPSGTGGEMVVTPDGRVVRADVVKGVGSGSLGYISHFATCPAADHFRETRTKKED